MHKSLILLPLLFLAACSHTSEPQTTKACTPPDKQLVKAVLSSDRTPENMARDEYRKPYQTLQFFGIEPDMTVVEIWPGRGWYTEILAPYLKESGNYIAAGFNKASSVAYYRKLAAEFEQKIFSQPELYGEAMLTSLEPPKEMTIAPEGSADMVLTFRNVHNWMRNGYTDAVYQAMYKALKPGGVLGVVEHRLPEDRKQDPQASNGYVKESVVIEQAKEAGFRLSAYTGLLANLNDTADHPDGVWSLPPTLRNVPDEEKEKYKAIGESHRMVLKFIKPTPIKNKPHKIKQKKQ